MSRLIRTILIFVLLITCISSKPASADAPDYCGPAATQYLGTYSGGTYLFCVPLANWNGDLVVYAHGYVSILEPAGQIPDGQVVLPDGTSIPQTMTTLGYAFAMTSYRENGLAVLSGVEDVTALVPEFTSVTGLGPTHTYLVGASEGGLVTALATEQHPETFTGGLAACGPVGDFRKQINYWGDFRVVFDAFYPEVAAGVLAGTTPVDLPLLTPIPPTNYVIDDDYWTTVISPTIAAAVAADLGAGGVKTSQLLRVTNAPVDPGDPGTILDTIHGIWWYNVFATNDGKAKLNGQPFDNNPRWYFGSKNDFWLNRTITLQGHRFDADQAALDEINAYQTSGVIPTQLVTLHTIGDPIVPYWHQTLYRLKAYSQGSFRHYTGIPILRYGHCNFKAYEVLAGFAVLVLKSGGLPLQNVEAVLQDADSMQEYERLIQESSQSHTIYLPALLNR